MAPLRQSSAARYPVNRYTEHVYEGDEQPRETNRYRLPSGEPCLEIRRDEDIADQASSSTREDRTGFQTKWNESGLQQEWSPSFPHADADGQEWNPYSFGGIQQAEVTDEGYESDSGGNILSQFVDGVRSFLNPNDETYQEEPRETGQMFGPQIRPPESTHFAQDGIHTFGASRVALTGSGSKIAPVKMYTTRTCPWCDRAKELLRKRGVTHIEEVRVDLDRYEGQKMRQITGRSTVPQIFIDGEHIGGFDDLEKLDDRGGLTRRLRGSD
jgi:glutaredoxin 3